MKPAYDVTALRASGSPTSVTRKFRGAPSDARIAQYFRATLAVGKYDLAVRYYPSKKGWMITDLRRATCDRYTAKNSGPFWQGMVRYPKVYPSEEAAIMKAIHMLAPPVQLDFNL